MFSKLDTVFILLERKQKKLFQIWFAHNQSQQFQEVNFFALIRYCVVIEQIARAFVRAQIKRELSATTNRGYR